MSLDWDKVTGFAADLPGAERATHYGGPAVKANGNAFLAPGREAGSFCLMIERAHGQALAKKRPKPRSKKPA